MALVLGISRELFSSKLRANSQSNHRKAALGQWIGLLALVISLYILWQIQIVLLVFAAAVLSTILNRVVQTLQRYRIKRSIAIAITVVVLLALIGFFGDCATHCRAIATILAASLSTTACLVRLATICDSRPRTVP